MNIIEGVLAFLMIFMTADIFYVGSFQEKGTGKLIKNYKSYSIKKRLVVDFSVIFLFLFVDFLFHL